MKVSFVIPIYNQLELTRACLESLLATTGGVEKEIILVDDCSDAATHAFLEKFCETHVEAQLITQKSNRGYSHCNNRGAAAATGDILFLVNNDLEFLDGWLSPMLDAFEKLERPGLVGNIQLDATTDEIDHAGVDIAWDTVISHKAKISRHPWGARKPYSKHRFVTAACCAIKRSIFLECGGFDEVFVNGCEDFDLCLRLDRQGYGSYVANKSTVRHHVSSTRGKTSLNQERNYRYFERKWRPSLEEYAALRWTDHYISTVAHSLRNAKNQQLAEALPRWLMLQHGPPATGKFLAKCRMERNERHWSALLDGKSPRATRRAERERYANWFKERISYEGFHPCQGTYKGVWIKETATVVLPKGVSADSLELSGEIHPASSPEAHGQLGLRITINDAYTQTFFPLPVGPYQLRIDSPPIPAHRGGHIQIDLVGPGPQNAYAFLGRKLQYASFVPKKLRDRLQGYRPQHLNRRHCFHSLSLNDEQVLDFKTNPSSPQNFDYIRSNSNVGINLVGWFKAELGIGESVRLAAKALSASDIAHALTPLKVNCMASKGDTTYDHLLTETSPYPINVFHIDAPQSADIDHHHGEAFRRNKYNIAYWAWELPDFPDDWVPYFKYYNEVWTPSDFVRDAVAMKSPLPVVTIPHCIDFQIPREDYREILDLPRDRYLFCFAYDLNSYQGRKNPQAVIEAYRQAFLDSDRREDVGLVIKTQSKSNNPAAYQKLLDALEGLSGVKLIDTTLSRQAVYGLMNACDSYISLHRAEGFGLTVAESMFMGKPVISTNWSATREFLSEHNGCPVDYQLIELAETHGPYQKGQLWADANPADAALKMIRLVNDADYGARLGAAAAKTIRQRFSPERVASLYEKRLKSICIW